ncbi:hypothetical protein SAMN05421761_10216 [Belliella pelovolcani]|uniref:Uncharacterized protein n=1 Tax=Belliella pelovolcani TaxID=529505 RepID=A0A1N7KEN8_9BACT|nr:hypothetical protein SAMN05421761_10216 [Belliella pelovolcani]
MDCYIKYENTLLGVFFVKEGLVRFDNSGKDAIMAPIARNWNTLRYNVVEKLLQATRADRDC